MKQSAGLAQRDTPVAIRAATAASFAARPEPSPGPRWLRPLVLLTVALILFARRPDAFLHPQFWAEDSVRFFLEADQLGARVILRPFAGYLHLVPRLVAAVAIHLDPAWIPGVFNAASLLVTLFVAGRCFSPRLRGTFARNVAGLDVQGHARPAGAPSDLLPALLWALALVLVPHTGEVLMALCNVQWIASLALVQWLVMAPPHSRRDLAADAVVITLAGLTGPFVIAFFPLFAIRWSRDRSRANALVLAIATACALIQLWFILHDSSPANTSVVRWLLLAANLSYRLVLSTLAGPNLPLLLPVWLRAIAGGVLLGLLASRLRDPDHRWTRVVLWSALVALLASAAFRTRIDLWAPYDYTNGDRYFYGAKVLLLWLIALEVMRPVRQRLTVTGLLALIFFANAGQFRLAPPPNLHWREYCPALRRGEAVDIPVNPGWKMHYPGRRK